MLELEILSFIFPGLAGSLLDRTKPYYLQAFHFFSVRIYAIFLAVFVIMQIQSYDTLDCISNNPDMNDMADNICMLEQGYIVDYRRHQVNFTEKWLRQQPHFAYVNGRPYEIGPGIAPLAYNETGSKYRYVTTLLWIDLAFFIQIWAFLVPSFIWASLRQIKRFVKNFNSQHWRLSSHLVFEAPRETVERAIADYQINTIRRHYQGLPKTTQPTPLLDECIYTLFRIAQSKLSWNILFVLLSQVAVTLGMALIWDALFTFGGNERHRFTKYGFELMHYWYVWYFWPPKTAFPYEYPGDKLFPSLIKCQYEAIGPSGETTKTDLLCVLESNYVMEKFMMLTWFYYLGFLFVDLFVLFYEFVWLANSQMRRQYVRSILDWNTPASVLRIHKEKYVSRLPEQFECPFQVAIFIPFMVRNIGHQRTSSILKHFIYHYNKRLGNLPFKEDFEQAVFIRGSFNSGNRELDFWEHFNNYKNMVEECQTMLAIYRGELFATSEDDKERNRRMAHMLLEKERKKRRQAMQQQQSSSDKANDIEIRHRKSGQQRQATRKWIE